jgi:hypothetical protein
MRTPDDEKVKQLVASYLTDETVEDKSRVSHRVLDAKRLYANKGLVEKYFKSGQRVEPIYEWRPRAGDPITESSRPTITAKGTEIVFIKKLGQGEPLKVYIPSGPLNALSEGELNEKYAPGEPVSDPDILATLPAGASIIKRYPVKLGIDILHECIAEPTVIVNARGDGKNQFMKPGDSLKFEDNSCLPLPKAELDTAWKVSNRSPRI